MSSKRAVVVAMEQVARLDNDGLVYELTVADVVATVKGYERIPSTAKRVQLTVSYGDSLQLVRLTTIADVAVTEERIALLISGELTNIAIKEPKSEVYELLKTWRKTVSLYWEQRMEDNRQSRAKSRAL